MPLTSTAAHRLILSSQSSPCYASLKNNVPTRLLRTKLCAWPEGTEDFVSHCTVKTYIQTIAVQEGVESSIIYGARVTNAKKTEGLWNLTYVALRKGENDEAYREEIQVPVCIMQTLSSYSDLFRVSQLSWLHQGTTTLQEYQIYLA